MSNTEQLTWDMFGQAGAELAQMVTDSGFRPDAVLAIARGGLFLAGAMSYALNVKLLHVVNVEFYTGRDERLSLPVMLPPVPDADFLAGLKVLICDDVADTGATLQLVQEFSAEHVAEVRTAVIYEKSRSLVKCDHVWKRTDDWIQFPWDVRVRPS